MDSWSCIKEVGHRYQDRESEEVLEFLGAQNTNIHLGLRLV